MPALQQGQDDDNDGDADDETPVVPKTPSVPKNRAGAGTSTALTKDEARYIFQTMVDNTKWPEVVKETNKKAPEGVERIVSNVKAHWVKFVGERVIGFYKN